MLQRFASALFGGDPEELKGSRAEGGRGEEEQEEEQDEDWILVECLAEACANQRGHTPSDPATALQEDEDDLVMVPWPSRSPSPLLRYASSTSLHSTDDEEEDEEEEEEAEEEGGFLRLGVPRLAESWLVTPPPCFTGGGQQVALSCNPLENLLIEHPSMSVYARHDLLRRGRSLLPKQSSPSPETTTTAAPAAKGKRRGRAHRRRCRRRHLTNRPETTVQQRRPTLHSAHCTAALSAVKVAQVTQPLSRNSLRRLNLLRPLQAGARNLQQPSQRRLNF